MHPNILLIGPRASGKTTIGRRLADRLDRPFVDLDLLVRAAFDEPTVQDIWAIYGEPGWRRQEVVSLRKAMREFGQVIALGGGVPCIDDAREMLDAARLRHHAIVIYLRVPVEELVRRLRDEAGDRPSLTGRGAIEEVPEIVAKRDPTYRATADAVIEIDPHSPIDVMDELIAAIGACENGDDEARPVSDMQ